MAKKKQEIQLELEEGDDFQTVYSDMITFVAVLFIMLFTMSYNKVQDEAFFTQMRIQFGGKDIEQSKMLTSEDLFVSELRGYIQDERLSQYALVLVDEQKIRLIMNDPLLFEPGSDTLTRDSRIVLRGFSNSLKKVKNPILIEGHTDNENVHNEYFESNWDLSMMRAYAVLRFFVDEMGMSEKQFTLIANAGNKPLVPNKNSKNRAMNRRVELNVVRVKRI
jgi:chemotaxis protein MotB